MLQDCTQLHTCVQLCECVRTCHAVHVQETGKLLTILCLQVNCCSVSQCYAVCCSVLQSVVVCCSVLQGDYVTSIDCTSSVKVCYSLLQCVEECCCVLQWVHRRLLAIHCLHVAVCRSVLQLAVHIYIHTYACICICIHKSIYLSIHK